MTLFRGSGEVGSGEQIDYLRSKNNLSDVDNVPEARSNLGLESLSSISGLTPADSTFIVGDGVNWVAESGATVRTSLGLNNVPNIDTTDASNVEITDSQNYYANSSVEDALAELGQSAQVVVDNVSNLQSGSFESGIDRIWLSGYYGVGTAGGGPLYRDSSDTTTADNGGTVFVDTDGVRWKRQETGIVTAEQFGARGDGTTDDTSACQAALDFAQGTVTTYKQVRFDLEYRLTSKLLVDGAIAIRGTGEFTQGDGDGVATLFELNPGVDDSVDVELRINGNRDNNTAVVGLTCDALTGPTARVLLHATGIDTACIIRGSSEGGRYDIHGYDCGILCEYRVDSGSNTPDENEIHLYGKNCDTFFRGGGQLGTNNNTATVHFNCENALTGSAINIEDGRYILSGIVRGWLSTGVGCTVDGAGVNIVFNGLYLIGPQATSVGVKILDCETVNGHVYVRGAGSGILVAKVDDPGELRVEINETKDAAGYALWLGDNANTKTLSGQSIIMSASNCDGDGLVLDDTSSCNVRIASTLQSIAGDELVFNANATNDRIALNRNNSGATITDNGAAGVPVIVWEGPMTDSTRSNITNPTQGMVIEMNNDDNLPNYYDAGAATWRLPSGSST